MKTLSLLMLFCFSHAAFADIPIQFDDTVSSELKAQVTDDLSFIQSVSADRTSPLHQEIFGPVNGANYSQWFGKRVFEFSYDASAGATTVAYHQDSEQHKIYVGDNYVNGNYPQIARLMTLFHEARHTEVENNDWEHALCPRHFPYRSIWTGADISQGYACDDTAYGSYASAAVMLNNISKFCTNCSSTVKDDAKIYSDDQSHRVIDEDAMAKIKADFEY